MSSPLYTNTKLRSALWILINMLFLPEALSATIYFCGPEAVDVMFDSGFLLPFTYLELSLITICVVPALENVESYWE